MIPPELTQISLEGNPLWYNTNIPLPSQTELFNTLYWYWYNRWFELYKRQHLMSKAEWIHYRLIYSRLTEFIA
jgi:hypothetical protein